MHGSGAANGSLFSVKHEAMAVLRVGCPGLHCPAPDSYWVCPAAFAVVQKVNIVFIKEGSYGRLMQ